MRTSLFPAMRSIAASAATVLFAETATVAAVDDPSISGWSGTAYHAGGWFTYNMAKPDVAMKFSSGFLLSPLYSAPIRKVAVVAARSEGGDKALNVVPFANGVENAAQVCALASFGSAQIIDFDPSDNVTAFRMYAGSSGSGYWTVSRICVFYGEKTLDEDFLYSALTGTLAKPDNLRAESFSTNSLAIVANPVGGASGYCFEVVRIDGVPETVAREDFVNASELSAGWTLGVKENAVLGRYTGTSPSSFPDVKTGIDNADDNAFALKIEKGNGSGEVKLEIVSPLLPAAVREVSFVSKRATGTPSSDVVSVYGRASESANWTAIGTAFEVSTSKTWTTNEVDVACDYRQIKFEFAAESAETCKNCGLDTLRVVYGGDETRVTVADGSATNALPRLELSGLETARYAFRAKAVGDGYGDSLWTDEEIVDLTWAGVGAAPLGVNGFEERFDALSNVANAVDFKTVPLDYWQIAKGSAMQETLNYTSGTSSTVEGVYALSDAGRTVESFALGSLATRDTCVMFGIALVNTADAAVERDMTLSFDMIQWSYRANKAAYALEWKVTGGETSILPEVGWTAVEIPESAPYAVGDEGCPEGKYVQKASVGISLTERLMPGEVLILRWRHPKTESGPMMAIDNVRLVCSRVQQALRITVR